MSGDYSLDDSYVSVGGVEGGVWPVPFLVRAADKTVNKQPVLAMLLIVALAIAVIIMLIVILRREGFNPTQHMRRQDSDQYALGAREHLSGRGNSAFAQQVQSGNGAIAYDANAAAGQPGSLGWQVLHSADFDCGNRKLTTDDAWSWMYGTMKEGLNSLAPKNDNDFSRVLSGQ